MARTLAGKLVEALFCGLPNRSRRVAVYTEYSDESASSDDGRSLFLMGGYVASSEFWPFVVDAWQEHVLDSAPAIPYLHMSEIGHKKFREEYGLTATQTNQKVDTAIDIITTSGGLLGVFSSIKVPLLETLCASIRGAGIRPIYGLKEPDYICYLAYAFHALEQAHKAFPDAERVDFVVGFKNKVSGHIVEFHEGLRSTVAVIEPTLEPLVGRVIPEFAKDSPGVQTADLMAWHVRKGIQDDVVDRNLWRLQNCGARPILGHEHKAEDLEALKKGIITYFS